MVGGQIEDPRKLVAHLILGEWFLRREVKSEAMGRHSIQPGLRLFWYERHCGQWVDYPCRLVAKRFLRGSGERISDWWSGVRETNSSGPQGATSRMLVGKRVATWSISYFFPDLSCATSKRMLTTVSEFLGTGPDLMIVTLVWVIV